MAKAKTTPSKKKTVAKAASKKPVAKKTATKAAKPAKRAGRKA